MTARVFSVDQHVQVRSPLTGTWAKAIVLRQDKQRVTVRYVKTGVTCQVSYTRIKRPVTSS